MITALPCQTIKARREMQRKRTTSNHRRGSGKKREARAGESIILLPGHDWLCLCSDDEQASIKRKGCTGDKISHYKQRKVDERDFSATRLSQG